MKSIRISALVGLVMILSAAVAWTETTSMEPSALLLKARGHVFYRSRSSDNWKPVHRNRFLFEGDRVKTDSTGQCKLTDSVSQSFIHVGHNTEIEIRKHRPQVLSGKVSRAEAVSDIIGNIRRKFNRIQKYTVVPRHIQKRRRGIVLETARTICLCSKFPDLVWENIGFEFAYRLYIGTNTYNIAKSENRFIRFKVPVLDPGAYPYQVDVVLDGKIIYSPEENKTLHWLADDQCAQFEAGMRDIEALDPENDFLAAAYLEDFGLLVASMDKYTQFFSQYPNANQMRPFLVKVYHDLGMKSLRQKETLLYNRLAD